MAFPIGRTQIGSLKVKLMNALAGVVSWSRGKESDESRAMLTMLTECATGAKHGWEIKTNLLNALYDCPGPEYEFFARRAAGQNMRAVTEGYSGQLDAVSLKAIWDAQGGICPYTGVPLELCSTTVIEHVRPLAKSGKNTPGNVVFTTSRNNTQKRDKHLRQWCKERPDLNYWAIRQRIHKIHRKAGLKSENF